MAARIAKLEAANGRWKSASAIALLFIVSMLLLSTRHAERVAAATRADRIEQDVLHARTIEAQDFVLKDADGHVYARVFRAGIEAAGRNHLKPNQPLGAAALQFYDENGHAVWTAPTKPQFMTMR